MERRNTNKQHNDNDPLFIREAVVKQLLSWPECVAAMEAALIAATNSSKTADDEPFSSQTTRTFTPSLEHRGVLLSMPGFVGNYTLKPVTGASKHSTLACKLVTSFGGNSQLNPPLASILATILLFDESTGRLRAMLEATEITAWRTAAVSLAATKHMYGGVKQRQRALAICGCGTQVSLHLIDFNDIVDCSICQNQQKWQKTHTANERWLNWIFSLVARFSVWFAYRWVLFFLTYIFLSFSMQTQRAAFMPSQCSRTFQMFSHNCTYGIEHGRGPHRCEMNWKNHFPELKSQFIRRRLSAWEMLMSSWQRRMRVRHFSNWKI